jgi:hypothetical protein
MAGVEEREDHAIAFAQRLSKRIFAHAPTQAVDDARELVPGDSTQGWTLVVAVVAPVMKIGPANGGGGVSDENAARFDFWRGQRFELERLSRLDEHGRQSLGHGCLPPRMCVASVYQTIHLKGSAALVYC